MGLKADEITAGKLDFKADVIDTAELSDELEKREGVSSVYLDPHQEAYLVIGESARIIEGPAVILINRY